MRMIYQYKFFYLGDVETIVSYEAARTWEHDFSYTLQ